ncbi:Sec-independent protein translocase protein TatB [Moritella viscosa]|uniref:Sec-independent protein translocase protein TatB n=1 Tax=Moritella viscosa TaxID=80854 RepID=A0A1K9ZQ54_9GAMM|nr:Sec-independent protein translocase protein TatB [Moritella viscosa]SGY93652.1 Sec-independent translocase [Moritella viscosa]SGY98408.1 Sec-independent translocase [Moritella viscosa]SGZ04809.1 Sec-independent translocase [Moritella viscosa]SGZ04953.1 Sec-independent translocase [Moritella viscosa]SHO08359.1 Sec-independent translocase [Moritella viscosa]
MFDIGFWEIVVISVLGLLVLGPERLPVAIRTVSTWVKTIKGAANSVKEELSHELKIQEMHDNLKKAEQQGMNNISPDLQSSIDSLRDAAASVTRPYADDKSTSTSTPSVDQVPKVAEQVIEQDKK